MIKNSQQDEKSRSQAKREAHELKALGIKLAGLSPTQLSAIPMSEDVRAELMAVKGLVRSALQRQCRYIATLLSHEDVAAIQAALTDELRPHAHKVAVLRETEKLRNELLAADESQFAAFVEKIPGCDPTRLRQLTRNARKELNLGKSSRWARRLIQYLDQLLAK